MNRQLTRLYKAETGKDIKVWEFGGFRQKGRWVLDVPDETMLEVLGRNFTVDIPDLKYIGWLEEKLTEQLNR